MSLLTNLVGYWALNESSGSALDSHGSNPLTENGTGGIGTATGKISNARDFEIDDKDYFSHSDNADLSLGSDQDFTLQAWVYIESAPGYMCVVAKWSAAGAGIDVEYLLRYNLPSNRFEFEVSNGSSVASVIFNATSLSINTWYLIHGWHDSVNNVVGISVNAATAETTSWSSGTQNTSHDFAIGRGGAGDFQYFDGLIDEVGFWKRVLTGAERTELYNSGNGKPYSDFGAAVNRRRRALITAA